MAIIQFSPKNIYNNQFWNNNASYTASFETTAAEIPASNLTNAKDNSQHDAIESGALQGIALHLPLDGYTRPSSYEYYCNELRSNEVVLEYNVAYYVNSKAIQLPREVGESVSGRLNRFETTSQIIFCYVY